jgi:hypothetical protein
VTALEGRCGVDFKREELGVKFDLLRLSHLRILLSETCRGVSPLSTPSFWIEPNRVSLSTGQSARRQHGRQSAVSDRSLYL